MEKVTLTTPVYTDAGTVEFALWSTTLTRKHPDAPAKVVAIYRETNQSGFILNGRHLTCIMSDSETSTTIDDLLKQLNKVNLSTKSLERRITERLQTDGKLGSGVLSGAPD
jgi:hypothetical protein